MSDHALRPATPRRLRSLVGLVCLSGLAASPLLAQPIDGPIDDTLTALEEWVRVEQQIIEKRNEWDIERANAELILNLYAEELTSLEARFAEIEGQRTQTDAERERLLSRRDELRAADNEVEAQIGNFEVQMKNLLTRLPAPLQATVEPLAARIPKDPTDTATPLTARMQNIVGILSQIDRFNRGVTLETESRIGPSGSPVQVNVMYFGIAQAYFADGAATFAGIGRPGSAGEGWVWETRNELAPEIAAAVSFLENTAQARYVQLPVVID